MQQVSVFIRGEYMKAMQINRTLKFDIVHHTDWNGLPLKNQSKCEIHWKMILNINIF